MSAGQWQMFQNPGVALYDDIAERYDATRGGERRGDEFAEQLDHRLPPDEGPILEVGVGTGVVAFGLRRRGRAVLGVDLSAAMLGRAFGRLGPVVVQGDACQLPVKRESVAHAVSVWVLQHIDPPQALLSEVARVLRRGGRYLVCPTNRMPAADPIEPILVELLRQIEQRDPARRRREVGAAQISTWGEECGFRAEVATFASREWQTTPEEQIQAIRDRAYPALVGLDDGTFEAVTGPAIKALRALGTEPISRHAELDVVTLRRP